MEVQHEYLSGHHSAQGYTDVNRGCAAEAPVKKVIVRIMCAAKFYLNAHICALPNMFVHQKGIFIAKPLKCSPGEQAVKSIANKIAFFSLKASIFHIKGSDDCLPHVHLATRTV